MAFAGPPLERPVELVRLLDAGLRSKPDEAALVSLERNWSWRELDQASTRLADGIWRWGSRPATAWRL